MKEGEAAMTTDKAREALLQSELDWLPLVKLRFDKGYGLEWDEVKRLFAIIDLLDGRARGRADVDAARCTGFARGFDAPRCDGYAKHPGEHYTADAEAAQELAALREAAQAYLDAPGRDTQAERNALRAAIAATPAERPRLGADRG